MRVMCDTNILVRAVISPYGPAVELLRMIARDHSLVTSLHVLSELYDVLRRPKIRKLHKLRDAKIRRVVSRIYKLATVVPLPTPVPVTVPRDPKDNPIVLTAVAGHAEILCTLDRHFARAGSRDALCQPRHSRLARRRTLGGIAGLVALLARLCLTSGLVSRSPDLIAEILF
jgi:putative PIN family toxin of toxin-antitoxin system